MCAGPTLTVTVINAVTRDPIPGATVQLIIDGNVQEELEDVDYQSDSSDGNGKKVFRIT